MKSELDNAAASVDGIIKEDGWNEWLNKWEIKKAANLLDARGLLPWF